MSSIVKQKVGKYVYLYESVSFRDEQGRPRNRRKVIGKIDPVTGKPIYKEEYIERMKKEGIPLDNPKVTKQFSIEQIQKSTVKEYGAFFLYKAIAQKLGLIKILKNVFTENWQEIFNLASYLVSSEEPAMYVEDWIQKSESFPVENMSSQGISDLLLTIAESERRDFYQQWAACRSEQEYLVLDITSINDVEWGYNLDGEDLAQVNQCILLGEKSGLPVFQTVYSGILSHVSTLKTRLAQISDISFDNLFLVLGKEFFSKKNVDDMLEDSDEISFVIAAPFTLNFIKELVEKEKKDIDRIENTIVIGNDILRGVSKKCKWSNKHNIHAHIFYNAGKAVKKREDLYAHVTLLKQEAKKDLKNPMYCSDFNRYLTIRKSKKSYTVHIRQEVVEQELKHSGWLVFLSNQEIEAKEAISIYKTKDVVKKGFLSLKKCLDLKRLRVHNDKSIQNKVFIGFVALIITSKIHKVMMEQGMYSKMTLKKLIKTLEKLRIQYINNNRIIYPITKEQKEIFKAFEVEEPV